MTKTAAVVIDSGPQNTIRFGAGPLRFGSQVVARRINVFGPFRAVMAGRIGTWVARDCHIEVKTNSSQSKPKAQNLALFAGTTRAPASADTGQRWPTATAPGTGGRARSAVGGGLNTEEPMSRFFYAHEIAKPEDVIPYLARQERHWKKGRSAYELAHAWVHADNIPASVRAVLDTCPDCAGAALVEGLFEREVDLRTPGHRSQTDLLAFVQFVHGHGCDRGRGEGGRAVR